MGREGREGGEGRGAEGRGPSGSQARHSTSADSTILRRRQAVVACRSISLPVEGLVAVPSARVHIGANPAVHRPRIAIHSLKPGHAPYRLKDDKIISMQGCHPPERATQRRRQGRPKS